jgi:hypothetical protein
VGDVQRHDGGERAGALRYAVQTWPRALRTHMERSRIAATRVARPSRSLVSSCTTVGQERVGAARGCCSEPIGRSAPVDVVVEEMDRPVVPDKG